MYFIELLPSMLVALQKWLIIFVCRLRMIPIKISLLYTFLVLKIHIGNWLELSVTEKLERNNHFFLLPLKFISIFFRNPLSAKRLFPQNLVVGPTTKVSGRKSSQILDRIFGNFSLPNFWPRRYVVYTDLLKT